MVKSTHTELPLKVFLGTSSGPTMNITINESIGNTSLCIITLVLAGNESSVQDFSVNIFTTDGTAIGIVMRAMAIRICSM